jgi:hypothetical protein
LAASLAAEGQLEIEVSTSPEEIHSEESEDMDESDEMILVRNFMFSSLTFTY